MSVTFTSQKFKASSLETRTSIVLDNENLEFVTDNLEGIKQITLSNDEIIEDINQILNYENKIFDAVIESDIAEQLIQLANLMKLQSKSENQDNSSIQASLATTDNSKFLNIVAFIDGDKIKSLDISVNEKQWNISVNQKENDLVKYCNFLKDKLSATPKVSQSLDLNHLLKLITNDENHQINYQLTPIQQNQYNLEVELPQFNWKHEYKISLDNPDHLNFVHCLDSELVEFLFSLTDEETVLKKAMTLTPHHEADNYNSGYLSTPNGNNRINYQIQINLKNNQNQFELSANNKTWTYQLDTSNLDHRAFLQHVNPSLAVALEIQEALTVMANDDKILAVLIRRLKNLTNNNAISVYSKDETTTELTVLIPSSPTDSSLQSVLNLYQEVRIEKTYINDCLRYKLSVTNDNGDNNAQSIKITQIIDSTGKIQVQTSEKYPVKVFSDSGIITHHSDQVLLETIEVEYNDYFEDATFTYHGGGQLIISNLIEGMKIEHYVKPPIQNILNGTDESFIILKPEEQISFLDYRHDKLDKFLTQLLSPENIEKNKQKLSQESSENSYPTLFLFRRKFGYIKNGKVVIHFEFNYAGDFQDGMALAQKDGQLGYINTTGKILIPFEFDNNVSHDNSNMPRRFWGGLCAVKKDGKWGYIDKTGKLVIPCQFDEADDFHDGLARVSYHEKQDGKTGYIHGVGYINKTGEVVIPFEFRGHYCFVNGLAAVEQYVQDIDIKDFRWGYIDKTGRWVIPCKFYQVQSFSYCGTMAEVTVREVDGYGSGKNKTGAINTQGQFIINPEEEISSIFCLQGLIMVTRNVRSSTRQIIGHVEDLINVKTWRTILSSFEDIRFWRSSKEEPIWGKKNNKWACFDTSGEMIADFQFDDVHLFNEGLAGIKQDDKWGYINESGEISIPVQFDDVQAFSEGLAFVRKGEKWGCINKTGQLLIPYQFDDYGDFNNPTRYEFQQGLARVIVDGQEYLIDKSQTMWVSESDYDKVIYDKIRIKMP